MADEQSFFNKYWDSAGHGTEHCLEADTKNSPQWRSGISEHFEVSNFPAYFHWSKQFSYGLIAEGRDNW